jgi:hypothetical protein
MADITISGNVTATSGSMTGVKSGISQVAITGGQVVYLDASNGGKVNLAINSAEASAVAVGIAVNGCDAGGVCSYITSGNQITVSGAPFTVGLAYYVSVTAGGIAPIADVLSGDYVTILGVASSTSVLDVNINASGVAEVA